MTNFEWPIPAIATPDIERDRSILHSSLWAASADALGWITELSHGEKGVIQRTGSNHVAQPVSWKRVIGGRGGPRIVIPAGTYSDDTQLRLAVSRAIRGDGTFDVEIFAKIELTVWPTYALGGGVGSKAAAANLARRGVNWFSNFFDNTRTKYVTSGGNGASMRIQPHVWSSAGDSDILVTDVFRNAIVTHGHPHGFCGAIFHALSLEHAIRMREIPSPEFWRAYLDRCLELSRIIDCEPQLASFWRSEWEKRAGESLPKALQKFHDEGNRDIDLVQEITTGSPAERYKKALSKLGCLTSQYRGSGWKTALAALSLAYFFGDDEIEAGLITSANELESDTDTVGTMAGALLGATTNRKPRWPLQDCEYLASEAQRLSAIARRNDQNSFTYPDLGNWDPPRRQYEAVGIFDKSFALAGLGELRMRGHEYKANNWVWQWSELPFGQTVLAKRKIGTRTQIVSAQLPKASMKASTLEAISRPKDRNKPAVRGELFGDEYADEKVQVPSIFKDDRATTDRESLDAWTDEVIKSNFDDRILGRMLNRCIEMSQSVEEAIGFASIISKAKLARMKRRR